MEEGEGENNNIYYAVKTGLLKLKAISDGLDANCMLPYISTDSYP